MTNLSKAAEPTLVASLITDRALPYRSVGRTEPLSLKTNAIWTVGGNGIYAASQWMMVTITTHMGTSSDVGHYALSLGICTPVFMLFNLQLRSLQITDASRRHTFTEYLAVRIVTSITALLGLIIFAYFSGNSTETSGLIVLLALFKCFESVSDVYQGLLQQSERMDYVARSLMLKGVLVLSAFGTVYFCTRSLLWATGSMVAAQLATLAQYDMRAATRLLQRPGVVDLAGVFRHLNQASWYADTFKPLFLRALPLGIAMMLISLYANVPRFVLNKYVGAAGLGVFAAVNYLSVTGSMVVTAVGTAVCPRLSQYAQNNRKEFRNLLTKLIIFAAALGASGIVASLLIGRSLLLWLYGKEYAAYSSVLIWSMVAAALMYVSSVLGFGATARGRLAGQPWAVGISTTVLFGSTLVLVPAHGLVGAAMAAVISSFVWLCAFLAIVLGKL